MILSLKKRYWDLRRAILNGRASVELSRLDMKFVPWSTSAIQPAALMSILNEIVINNRRSAVEFGCGISTLYMARVLSEQGGRLISFEDNIGWAAHVRSLLARQGLSDSVTLVEAPLRQGRWALSDLHWYDEQIVESSLAGVEIDFALVDGPPAYEVGKGLARYPAFPAIAGHLSERCAVMLDDIGRPGEQQVLAHWRTLPEFDLRVEVEVVTNIALCRRGSYFDSRY